MNDRDKGFAFCRTTKHGAAFLCDRCGVVHYHSPESGPRAPHCVPRPVGNFGTPYSNYELSLLNHSGGILTSEEGKTLHRLSVIAHQLTENMANFLSIAKIDPKSTAVKKLATAEKALRELASVHVDRKNPFEVITDDNKIHQCEDE